MTAPSPDLVIGVCTHNGGGRMEPTLRSLDALRDPARRISGIVIVDNASSDDTAGRVGRLLAKLARPSRLLLEGRIGKSNALETLFRETTQPFVAIVDDDVVLDPGWAVEVLACADRRPGAGAVGGRIDLDLGPSPPALALAAQEHLARQELGPAEYALGSQPITLAGAAILQRREAVEACGYFHRRRLECRRGAVHANGVDSECSAMMRAAGWELWYTPAARAVHTIAPHRQTPRYLRRLAHACGLGEAYLLSLLHAPEPDPAWAARMAAKARRRLWKETLLRLPGAERTIRRAYARGRADGWSDLLASLQARAG